MSIFLTSFLSACQSHDPILGALLMAMIFVLGFMWSSYFSFLFSDRPVVQLVVNQALVMQNGQAQFYQQRINV